MKARIYKPAKTAMQSGRANTRKWTLEFEPAKPRRHDPLMGWTSSGDMEQQVRLHFDDRAEAEAYCRRYAIDYVVREPRVRHVKPKSYASNFKWDSTR